MANGHPSKMYPHVIIFSHRTSMCYLPELISIKTTKGCTTSAVKAASTSKNYSHTCRLRISTGWEVELRRICISSIASSPSGLGAVISSATSFAASSNWKTKAIYTWTNIPETRAFCTHSSTPAAHLQCGWDSPLAATPVQVTKCGHKNGPPWLQVRGNIKKTLEL